MVWCNLLPHPERANCASLGGSGVVAMVLLGLWLRVSCSSGWGSESQKFAKLKLYADWFAVE